MKNITYISAGAGSGKTTRIVNELVKELGGDTRPSQIIMTTFTQAAAQEMQERAKLGLLKAQQAEKANEIGAATIGTIHSVCLKFIQKYWYLIGLSPDTQEMDENDFKTYIDRSLFDLVSEEDMQSFEQWRKVLDITHQEGNATKPYISYWRDWLRAMVDKVRYYHIEDLQQSRDKSIEQINAVFTGNAFNRDEYDRCKQEYIDIISTNGRLKKRLDYILNYDPLKEEGKVSSSYKEGKDNYIDAHNAWLLAAGKAAFSDKKKDAAIAIVNKLFDILTRWQDEYKTYKRSKRMLDYNDMEVYFLQLLDQEEVQAELSQYKLVLVDEFQDCNPMQVQLFSRISELVKHNIWVGDPKQAIYGFRGTDTALVKEVSDQIIHGQNECQRDTLDTNYRSRPELVHHVNDTFEHIFSRKPFNLPKNEIVLNAGRTSLLTSPHIQEWIINKTGNKRDYSGLAYGIQQLVEGKKTYVEPKDQPMRLAQYGDIAILVRKNSTISTLTEALRAFGIPFYAPQDSDKKKQPIEQKLLMALVQYKLSPKYRPHLRADILHLLKDIPTEELLKDYFAHITAELNEQGKCQSEVRKKWKDTDPLIERIEKITVDCYAMNIYDTLTTFMDQLNLYDVVAMWGDVEIRRSNISRLLRLAQGYDHHCEILEINPTYADYVNYMDNAQEKDELNLDSPSVKILTMHKSKGLEWPIVIYYDLDNNFTEDEEIVKKEFFGIREQRNPDRSYWLRVFPTITTDSGLCPYFYTEDYFIEARARICADEQRLYYVSLTRARDILITISETADAPIYAPKEVTSTYALIDTDKTRKTVKDLPYMINPSETGVKSELRSAQTTEVIRIGIHSEIDSKYTNVVGTCIHNIYAACNPSMDDAQAIEMAQTIIDTFTKPVPMRDVLKANEVITAVRALYDYLTTQYGAPTDIGHEVPFSFIRENGQLLRGEIDLLWHTQDGVVLVDYKNVSKDEANPEHYKSQMETYREVIEAAGLKCKGIVLFYATLGQIIELK